MKLLNNRLAEEYLIRSTIVSDINEHLPVIKTLAAECTHVTEFGVFIGNATIGILAGYPKKVIGYDIPETYNHKRPYEAVELIKELAVENNIEYVFIVGDVHEVTIEETDFLFLDTNQREKTRNELERHHKNVRKYIASHDTVYLPEQLKAFKDFVLAHSDEWQIKEHYTYNNGLIVLERIK